MKFVHKLLSGEGAGEYLPFALSRLRALEAMDPTGFFTQSFEINGTLVQVEQTNIEQYVRIIRPGAVYFEFMTSGAPIKLLNWTQGGLSGQSYKVGIVGVSATLIDKKVVATPTLLGNERTDPAVTHSLFGRRAQVQLVDEPVAYVPKASPTGTRYERALYESWAPGTPYTGVLDTALIFSYPAFQYVPNRASATGQITRDIGFDIPWEQGIKKQKVQDAYLRDPADWPRATGYRTVVHPTFGTRSFAIYVDSFDQVSVFPVSEITKVAALPDGSPKQNVLAEFVQYARVPMPSWVYKKTERFESFFASSGHDGLGQFPDHDWKINHTGTKMCAVVFERKEAVFDAAFFAPYAVTDPGVSGPDTFFPTESTFQLNNYVFTGALRFQNGGFSGDNFKRYHTASGVLDVEIKIDITDSAPEAFTISLVPTVVRRPTETAYCTFLAGYTWHDIKAPTWTKALPVFDAHAGDLCLLDIERYARNSDGYNATFYSLKNITTQKEIRTFGGSTEGVNAQITVPIVTDLAVGPTQIVAADMTTLSFVLKRQYRHDTDGASEFTVDVGTFYGTFKTRHLWCLSVYTLNKYRESFFPPLLDNTWRTFFERTADMDARVEMNRALPGLTLMALNVNPAWGETEMDRLRLHYCRKDSTPSPTFPAYNPAWTGGIPYVEIRDFGLKFWNSTTPTKPTATTLNYYYYNLDAPYPMFDCTEPMPTWGLYTKLMLERDGLDFMTTFFVHPRGSWALWDSKHFFNSNKMLWKDYFLDTNHLADLDPTKIEHCVFDRVHIVLEDWAKTEYTLDTTFFDLYNQAIVSGDTKITDGTLAVKLSDIYAQLTVETGSTPDQPAVTTSFLKMIWGGGTYYYREDGYSAGDRDFYYTNGSMLVYLIGGLNCLTTGHTWSKEKLGEPSFVPNLDAWPFKFSSCTMVSV